MTHVHVLVNSHFSCKSCHLPVSIKGVVYTTANVTVLITKLESNEQLSFLHAPMSSLSPVAVDIIAMAANLVKYYQPAPRHWHRAAPIGDRVYLWGGLTEDFSASSRRKLASVVEIYDPYLEAWQQKATTGTPPPGMYNGGCTSSHDSLLWYGGSDGTYNSGIFHQLNTTTLKWEEVHQSTAQGPMAKLGCGLALFQEKVGLFGGYGIPTGPNQPGSTFTKNTRYSDGTGWTNEFHLFDLQEGM